MNRLRLFVIVAVLALVATWAVAQETATVNPLDPTTNTDANACFSGGTLDGKCDSDLLWNAGWFLIRYEEGLITLEDFQQYYSWILPQLTVDAPIVVPDSVVATTNCYSNGSEVRRGGPEFLKISVGVLDGVEVHSDISCTSLEYKFTVVEAPNEAEAIGLCAVLNPDFNYADTFYAPLGYPAGSYFVCFNY